MPRIVFVGHATVLIEIGGVRLLTDPLLRGRVAHLRRVVPFASSPGLTEPTAVLISHAHFDHLDLPSLRLLGAATRVVLPRGWADLARRAGLRDVIEVEPGQRIDVGGVEVRATPARHDGHRLPGGRDSSPVGYVVDGGRSVYFAGDTDIFDGMRDLAGGLDVALLPVAGWGRRLPPGHLDPQRAARALTLLRPRCAVPIHWGTYAAPRSGAGSDVPPRQFARAAAAQAPDVEVRILLPGESTSLD